MSSGEMARALAAGFGPEQIVFSGVGKTADELRSAIRAGVGHLNVESREELELAGRIAEAEGAPVRVGIRVNPDVTTDTHPYISTGKSGIKFGVPTDQVHSRRRVRPRPSAARAHDARDAPGQPAGGHRAVPPGDRPPD